MPEPFDTVLADYERRAAAEKLLRLADPDAFDQRKDAYLLSVGPETGRMLELLVTGAKATRIVEIGASYGYSTLWLAHAARTTGGKVDSLELSSTKVEHARAQLARAGLGAYVEFHVGDAVATLERLPGPFDFVLLDLWKDLYVPCFERVHPKLAPGALIAADNMTFPPTAIPDAQVYRAAVRAKPDMDSVLLPIGSGIELSRKRSD
jgi:predicted O-methyltransferase YrrM